MYEQADQSDTIQRRSYFRRHEVEEDVQKLQSMRSSERERAVLMLCTLVAPGKSYPPGTLEVLVWAVRHGCRRVSKAHDEAFARLYAASAVFLRAKIKAFAYSSVEAELIVELTLNSMMEQLLKPDADISFWECQFLRCLKYRLDTISAKSHVRRTISDATSIDDETRAFQISDASLPIEEVVILRTLLDSLTDEERQVLYLKCVDQLPEESSDPSVDSIARRIGRTGRTVRNILMRIRERHNES